MGLLERDHLGEENLLDRIETLERRLASLERSAAVGSSLSGDHGDLTGLGDDDHTLYLLADGSRGLTDSLSVVAGKTIDGVDLSAHGHTGADGSVQVAHADLSGLTANNHHNRQHSVIAAADHTVVGSNFDVVALTAVNTLGLRTPSYQTGAFSKLLRTDSNGHLRIEGLGIGLAAVANCVRVTDDVRAGGGVYAGDDAGDPGAGEILATGDLRLDGGVYVGDKGGVATANDLRADGDLCAGSGVYIGDAAGEPLQMLHLENTAAGDADAYARIESSDTGEMGFMFYHDNVWKWTIDSGVAAGHDLRFSVGSPAGGEKARIDTDGALLIGDTANAEQTVGLTINQGANDDEIIALKSSDVAHGMTDLTETDSFVCLYKQTAASGGLTMRGLTESEIGLNFIGDATADDTGKSTSANAAIQISGRKKTGTTSGVMGTNANLLAVRDHNTTRFILDKEGELHSDAVIGAGNDWDEWDDLALAADLSRLPRAKWDETLKYHAEDLERAGLITLSIDEDGIQHAFVKHKAMLLFYACCFREVGQKFARYEEALIGLGVSPQLLEGRNVI